MVTKAFAAQMDRRIREVMRRHLTRCKAIANRYPKMPNEARGSWRYKIISGYPTASCDFWIQGETSVEILGYSIGPRRRKIIISKGKKFTFVPKGGAPDWSATGGTVYVQKRMQKARKADNTLQNMLNKQFRLMASDITKTLNRYGAAVGTIQHKMAYDRLW